VGLTLREIRSNCAEARETFARARSEHFALGAFNLDNQETLIAVAKAAAAKQAPVLVEVSKGEVDAWIMCATWWITIRPNTASKCM
jgi:fructose-bisphosphate aldolase class II